VGLGGDYVSNSDIGSKRGEDSKARNGELKVHQEAQSKEPKLTPLKIPSRSATKTALRNGKGHCNIE
jgi:hypothetical protein